MSVDTPDYQRGAIYAQGAIGAQSSGGGPLDVNVPPTTETLVVLCEGGSGDPTITVTGAGTGIPYPGTLMAAGLDAGVSAVAQFLVAPFVDPIVTVAVSGGGSPSWSVYADNAHHVLVDLGAPPAPPVAYDLAATDNAGGFLWLITLAGAVTQVTNVPAGGFQRWDPAISPDGQLIALPNPAAGGDIVIVQANNGGYSFVSTPNNDFAFDQVQWSPDGTMFAFADTSGDFGGISVMPIDGSSETSLVVGTTPYGYQSWDWLPDSSGVMVIRIVDTPGGTDICAMSIALDGTQTIIHDSPLGTDFATPAPCIAVSRDSTLYAWTNRDPTATSITVDNGGTLTDIGPSSQAVSSFGISFGPSNRIAFCMPDAPVGGNEQVWTINPDGTGLTQITSTVHPYLSVRWRP